MKATMQKTSGYFAASSDKARLNLLELVMTLPAVEPVDREILQFIYDTVTGVERLDPILKARMQNLFEKYQQQISEVSFPTQGVNRW